MTEREISPDNSEHRDLLEQFAAQKNYDIEQLMMFAFVHHRYIPHVIEFPPNTFHWSWSGRFVEAVWDTKRQAWRNKDNKIK